MPSDLYAERLRVVSGSSNWTLSTMTGSNPNGIASEPTGSLLRTQDGGIWINSNGGTEWQRLGNGVVTGSYTATGGEGSQATVTLPVAFASNQYKVFITNVSGSSVSAYQVPENLRTTTSFKVNSTSPFAANDKLDYLAVSGSIYAGAGTQTVSGSGGGGGLFSLALSSTPTSGSTGFTTWWYQWTGATTGDGAQGPWMKAPTTAGANHWSARSRAVPSTPYTVTMLVAAKTPAATAGSQGIYVGWSDAATNSKAQMVYWRPGQAFIGAVTLTNATTVSAAAGIDITNIAGELLWIRLVDNGTTVSIEVSPTGDSDTFYAIWTQLKSTGFLGASGYSYLLYGGIGTVSPIVVQLLSFSIT